MNGSLARGYKVALAILVVEVLLAFGLLSSKATVGIFTILSMVFVGAAWLPAAFLIWREEEGTLLSWLIAGACGLVGGLCLLTFGKWMLLSLVVR